MNLFFYSGQKKKVNGPEGAKYFSPVWEDVFFLAPSVLWSEFSINILWLEGDM